MNNFHLNEKIIFYPTICIFLTINFCENLQEYIFVCNQFLIIKIMKKNAKILNKFNILAFFSSYFIIKN